MAKISKNIFLRKKSCQSSSIIDYDSSYKSYKKVAKIFATFWLWQKFHACLSRKRGQPRSCVNKYCQNIFTLSQISFSLLFLQSCPSQSRPTASHSFWTTRRWRRVTTATSSSVATPTPTPTWRSTFSGYHSPIFRLNSRLNWRTWSGGASPPRKTLKASSTISNSSEAFQLKPNPFS